ncbi:MAG TPA: multicopper oxidase domain-containing protein [Stellaceae bacterium]|nr:multicopper oxidase domain-containing protein [Stellaceae bacterium]
MWKLIGALASALLACVVAPLSASANGNDPCPHPASGSPVTQPPDLFSKYGVLNVSFDYYTSVDAGRTLFCFVTPDGLQSPTLHVKPGDTLNISVTNRNPLPPPGSPTEVVSNAADRCGDVTMTITSLNVHFHGTNTKPGCHSDEVIHTIINSGETFKYSVKFPPNEPPGLYWYHPHVHGIAEGAVQGGASGAIVVEGIEDLQPAVVGLPERVLIIRDQTIPSGPTPGGAIPSWDVSLNYVPIAYPGFTPAIIQMKPDQQEFWRVANASADTIIDLQVQYDGAPQTLQVVGLDGVPTGSQDGTRRAKLVTQTEILLAPAARAEFIVKGPSAAVKNASFLTLGVDTGPGGDSDPQRPLARIMMSASTPPLRVIPASREAAYPQQFEGLDTAPVTAKRTLYFSEVLSDPNNPASPTNFFITVDGATPTLFDPNNPPAITTKQGAVEDWTIENRTQEHHEFHMHQIHFLLLEQNGVPVSPEQRQYLDMIQVPYWTGAGPYPSVKVRMDFRGMDVGDFVYHCHILGHEDNGMMATIRVLPR